MDPTLWASRTSSRSIPDAAEVVLALDGSFNQDTTALAACAAGEVSHLDVVGLWENPNEADESNRIDVLDVENTIRARAAGGRSSRSPPTPFRWQRSLAVLADEHIPVRVSTRSHRRA
jgi:hypothetical protein